MMSSNKKILAISSGGGHWIELMRLVHAFRGHTVSYVTVKKDYRMDVPESPFYTVNDATSWNKLGVLILALMDFVYRV